MTMSRLTLGSPGVASPGLAVPAASASPRTGGLVLFLDGVDQTVGREIRAGTLRVRQAVDGRASLEYRHQVIGGGQHLRRGQRVQLRFDGIPIFTGVIEGFDEEKFVGHPSLGIQVRAVDLWGILERRYVTGDEEYEDQPAGFIVRDLVAKYAAGEGLTTNSVQDGPVLDVFTVQAYTRTVAAAIREVAARADMVSGVDANRDVILQARTAQPASVALADNGTAAGLGVAGAGYAGGRESYQGLLHALLGPSIKGYWRLSDAFGVFHDVSGNGHHLHALGTVTRGAPGLLAKDADAAIALAGGLGDGVGVSGVPTGLAFGTGDFWLAGLMRATDLSGGRVLINTRGSWGSASGHPGWRLSVATGRLVFEIADGTNHSIGDLTPLAFFEVGKTYHIVVNADRDGVASAFINGILRPETVPIASVTGSVDPGDNFRIGLGGVGGSGFAGVLDEWACGTGLVTPEQARRLADAAFGRLAENPAPPMLALEGTVSRSGGMEGYRNRQTIRYGADLTPVTVEDPIEQAARAALEGGTGIYHVVEDRPDIDTETEALAYARAQLRRYRLADTLRFITEDRSLRPGQLLPVSLPAHDLAGMFLVQSVEIQDLGARRLRWTIDLTSGEPVDLVGAYYRHLQGEA